MYLDKEIYCIFKAVLFSTKCHLFHNFIFFCSNNHNAFLNHALKFQYQRGHLKVNIIMTHSTAFRMWESTAPVILFTVGLYFGDEYVRMQMTWPTFNCWKRQWSWPVYATSHSAFFQIHNSPFYLKGNELFSPSTDSVKNEWGCTTESLLLSWSKYDMWHYLVNSGL